MIARFFNTVGPRQSGQYGMVIPRFIRQALAGEPITVYGDGSQTRCFVYVGDTVRAAIELMEHEGTNGEVYNVGNDREISMLDLAKRVVELADSESEISFVPFDEAYGPDFEDMSRRAPDLTKLRGTIAWRDLRGIDDVLRSTIESVRSETTRG